MRMKKTAKVNQLILEQADLNCLNRAHSILGDLRDFCSGAAEETSKHAHESFNHLGHVLKGSAIIDLSRKPASSTITNVKAEVK